MVNSLMLAKVSDYVSWWQLVLIALLIAVIIFYVMYRKRQM